MSDITDILRRLRDDGYDEAADEIERLRSALKKYESDDVRYLKKLDSLRGLLLECKRRHYYCEDSWYSCPKAEDGCSNESEGDECNCGADAFNAKIDAALAGTADQPSPTDSG